MTHLLLLAATAISISDIPAPNEDVWVSDVANELNEAEKERLNEKIAAFEKQTTNEIVIVIVPSVSGDPREFGIKLFNRWGIGKAKKNNGLLVLLTMDKRQLDTITGVGVEEILTKDWLESMQDSEMVPHFKKKQYALGLEKGLAKIMQRLAPAEKAPEPTEGAPVWLFVVGGGALILVFGYLLFRRRDRSGIASTTTG